MAILAAAFAATSARADTLVLRDGDVLSGELVEIAGGYVTFKTTLSGQMMVSAEEVKSVATGKYMCVALDNGPTVPARFVVCEGATRLMSDGDSVGQPLDLAAVTKATPLPESRAGTTGESSADEERPQFTIESGVAHRSRGDDYTDAYARFGLERDLESFGYDYHLLLDRADPQEFPRWLRGDAEWRLGDTDGFYPAGAIEIERDMPMALQLRGSATLGVGRLFQVGDRQSVEVDLGAGVTSAYYDADMLRHDIEEVLGHSLWAKADVEDQWLHGRLRLRYVRALFEGGAFTGQLKLYPDLTGLSAFHARSESSLLLPLSEWLNLKLNLLVDYDSTPRVDDLDKWSTTVGAGVRVDF
ncbi:MAG TPA: DUF481 domain-containing protein [Candidatus Hydrogenedentes bacterium]|nr:DUF481 domain-containing protein [Candidatus Hydrogenedentota bacterium]